VPVQVVSTLSAHTTSGGAMEAEIRIICVAFTGLVALAAVSAHAAPNPIQQNWQLLGPPVTFGLGDQTCGEGWHRALRRDWRGDWWWGPCVPNR
jgi:hypothetical protein